MQNLNALIEIFLSTTTKEMNNNWTNGRSE
jgi:hypothetical protein